MDDDEDTRCRGCGTNFASYRTLQLHRVHSQTCGRKRKLVEDMDDENSDGDGAVDQLLPPEGVNDMQTDGMLADYAALEEMQLRIEQRIREQRGDSFHPVPKPFSSFTESINLAALHPDGYFGNRAAFDGNNSEFLFGMHFVENPRNTVDAVNTLRDLLKRDDFRIDDVVMDQKTRMKKLYAMINEKDKFQKVPLFKDLSMADRGVQVPFYVRSLHAAACRLVDRFDATEFDLLLNPILNDDGVRVYNREIASSDRLQRSKEWVSEKFGPEVVTLPLTLGWDGVRALCTNVVPCLYRLFTMICTNLLQCFVQIFYKYLCKSCTTCCTNIVKVNAQILYKYCAIRLLCMYRN